MRVTAITPTGDRPLAFALCQRWMAQQTKPPDQWIVVDDGRKPCEWETKPVNVEYVRREPGADRGPTLGVNLWAALKRIAHEGIVIIEDDEYYAPGYVAQMASWLSRHEVIGIGRSRYYHLPTGGYLAHGNMRHASLAETAFRRTFLSLFTTLLAGETQSFLDTRLWGAVIQDRHRANIFVDSEDHPLYLGIKGLPGRAGIGMGHNGARYPHYDETREVLRRWVPLDHPIYLDIIEGRLTEKNYLSVLRT
jgi:hypothetical protein